MTKKSDSDLGELSPADIQYGQLPVSGPLRGDFTYQLIRNLNIEGRSFARSLWAGAILKDCHFTRTDFSKSDFAGTKFINCTFIECNLEPDELRSCLLQDCLFEDCNLAGLHSISSQFRSCQFRNCDMQRLTLRESYLQNCQFENSPMPRSSITLNRFEGCSFVNQTLGDATILFVFFVECSFRDCTFNAESVGFSFGLSREALAGMQLIYLGDQQAPPDEMDVISLLIDSYKARRWFLGVCLLQLNFSVTPDIVALRAYLDALGFDAKRNGRLDLDEVTFFVMVLEELGNQKRLPFFAAWSAMRDISTAIDHVEETTPGFKDFSPPLFAISSKLRILFDDRLAEFADCMRITELDFDDLSLKLRMHKQPRKTLDEAIPADFLSISDASLHDFTLTKSEQGSWYEYWDVALAGIGAVHVALATIDTTWERLLNMIKNAEESINVAKKIQKAKQAKKSDADNQDSGEGDKPDSGEKEIASESRKKKVDLATMATILEHVSYERRNLSSIDKKALQRLDAAIQRLSSMSNSDFDDLMDYVSPNLENVERI